MKNFNEDLQNLRSLLDQYEKKLGIDCLEETVSSDDCCDSTASEISTLLIAMIGNVFNYTYSKLISIVDIILEPSKKAISTIFQNELSLHLMLTALLFDMKEPDPFGNIGYNIVGPHLIEIIKMATDRYFTLNSNEERMIIENKFMKSDNNLGFNSTLTQYAVQALDQLNNFNLTV